MEQTPTPSKEETSKPSVSQENDLRARLKAATEKKEPSKVANSNAGKDFYQNDEDFTPPSKEPDQPKPATQPEPKEKTVQVTSKMKEASANSIIGVLDITNRMFIPMHNRKFKKKFTEEEQKRLDKLQYKEKEDITEPEDVALVTKCERMLKKHNKKLEAIPLNEQEKTDLRTQLMAYMDYKEKVLPPEVGLCFSLINILGSRIIDVVTD